MFLQGNKHCGLLCWCRGYVSERPQGDIQSVGELPPAALRLRTRACSSTTPVTATAGPSGTSPAGEATVPPEKVLADIADVGGLVPAVVTSVDESTAGAWARDVGPVELDFERMRWARPCIDENRRDNTPKGAAQALRRTLE